LTNLNRANFEKIFTDRDILDVLGHLPLILRAIIDECIEKDHTILEKLEKKLVISCC
jgi:hypothetical protein